MIGASKPVVHYHGRSYGILSGRGRLYTGILWYLYQLICFTLWVLLLTRCWDRLIRTKLLFVGSITSGICELQGYLEGIGETKERQRARKGKGRLPSGQLGRGAKATAFPWTCSQTQQASKSFCHSSPLARYTFIGACPNSSFAVPIYDALNDWHMLNQVHVLQANWLLSICIYIFILLGSSYWVFKWLYLLCYALSFICV